MVTHHDGEHAAFGVIADSSRAQPLRTQPALHQHGNPPHDASALIGRTTALACADAATRSTPRSTPSRTMPASVPQWAPLSLLTRAEASGKRSSPLRRCGTHWDIRPTLLALDVECCTTHPSSCPRTRNARSPSGRSRRCQGTHRLSSRSARSGRCGHEHGSGEDRGRAGGGAAEHPRVGAAN